jgi:hypothetical protein
LGFTRDGARILVGCGLGFLGSLVVADACARIAEGLAFFGNELPSVTVRRKGDLEHAVSVRVAHFAVGYRKPQGIVAPAARPDHDLANAMLRVGDAVGILRSEPLVGVLVSDEHQVCVRVIQILPERF